MCRDFGTTYKVQVEMRMIPTLSRDDYVDTDNPGCQLSQNGVRSGLNF